MIVGKHLAYLDREASIKGRIRRIYYSCVGTRDFHTQVRYREVFRSLQGLEFHKALDLGCGTGMLDLMIAEARPQAKIFGLDVNPKYIEIARTLALHSGLPNLEFYCADANSLLERDWDEPFDLVLLIDVIEHIEDDMNILYAVSRVLDKGGVLIISVPTPTYPVFFGVKFHAAIGHLRAGYTVGDLESKLATAGFFIENIRYYTRFVSSLSCALFYRFVWGYPLIEALFTMLFLPIAISDRYQPLICSHLASSLMVTARKR